MSQSELAVKLDLSFQQIQKYERGTNRVSASTLHRIAHILDAPLSWFFESLQIATESGPAATPFDQFLTMADAADVAALWPQLPANLRRKMTALMHAMTEIQDY
jgi:transcriptional regulator with XRE-family HTH domain